MDSTLTVEEGRIEINRLDKDALFAIAKIIDNNFIGSEKTFTANKLMGRIHLTTNKCDWVSLINVFHNNTIVTSIQRVADDTDGWQEIHYRTAEKIIQWYNTLSNQTK